MEIKNKILKITGSSEILNELELGQDVELCVKGSVITTQDFDEQDGSLSRTYKVKISAVEFK